MAVRTSWADFPLGADEAEEEEEGEEEREEVAEEEVEEREEVAEDEEEMEEEEREDEEGEVEGLTVDFLLESNASGAVAPAPPALVVEERTGLETDSPREGSSTARL